MGKIYLRCRTRDVETRFSADATIHSAEDAFKIVLSDVGCNAPELDNHDIRMVDETLNGTTSTIGWHSKLRGIIDRESESAEGGYAGLNIIEESRPEGFDTDQDGMPDWWEQLAGSNPTEADNNADPDRDGYTLLEDYLNWLAETHRIMGVNAQTTISLQSLFAGFTKAPAYSVQLVSGTATANITDGNLQIKTTDAGLTAFDVTVTDSEGTTMTRRVNVAASGDVETAVDILRRDNRPDEPVYNLNGQRIDRLQKGINIQNGKKIVVR